jgi:hypothetical protein
VLRHFDVPWFVTAGWSGSGPHALACAANATFARGSPPTPEHYAV